VRSLVFSAAAATRRRRAMDRLSERDDCGSCYVESSIDLSVDGDEDATLM